MLCSPSQEPAVIDITFFIWSPPGVRADVRETDRFQLGGPQETQGQGSQEDSLGLGRGDNCTAIKQAIFILAAC